MLEKRRQERYPLNVPIKIKCLDDTAISAFEAYSRDISSTGVFIKTDAIKLQSMQKVHLELTLTIDKVKELFGRSKMITVEIDGSVVRSHEDGIVIEFEKNYSICPAALEN